MTPGLFLTACAAFGALLYLIIQRFVRVTFPADYFPPGEHLNTVNALRHRLLAYAKPKGCKSIELNGEGDLVLNWASNSFAPQPDCPDARAMAESVRNSHGYAIPRIEIEGPFRNISLRAERALLRRIDKLDAILQDAAERMYDGETILCTLEEPSYICPLFDVERLYLNISFRGNRLPLGFIYDILRRYAEIEAAEARTIAKAHALPGMQAI